MWRDINARLGAAEVADSERGRGTRFSVYLPVHHGTEGAPRIARAEPQREWGGGGRVLLVEDEDMVRAVASRALTRAGYAVTTASDGDEGLEIMAKIMASGEEFDLVVSDVVMPVMDGPTMAREIRASSGSCR